jgi:G2/mitotic-specific cyclin 3/4
MMAVGGLKAAAKRTAFGDVSNTTKEVAAARDISTAPGKPLPQPVVRPMVAQENVAAFLRPAQRPLNAAVKPSFAPNPIESGANSAKVANLLQHNGIGSRPSAAVYRDPSAADQPPQPTVQNHGPVPTGPAYQSLAPRHYKSQPYLKPDQYAVQCVQTKPVKPATIEPVAPAIPSDPIYEDALEQPLPQSPKDSYESYMQLLEEKENGVIHGVHEFREAHEVNEVAKALVSVGEAPRQLPALPQGSEPEEHWEEEEDEEIYDEQGYTTAHSYRSRGDNTTGGATTVLLPKVTNKVKKELADAKALVESSRTAEEIDDEAWDTSMVAEYGEEIFAYMRELEVSLHPSHFP